MQHFYGVLSLKCKAAEREREVERERQTLPFLFSAEDAGRSAMRVRRTKARRCSFPQAWEGG